MSTQDYHNMILRLLSGNFNGVSLPPERLDWQGVGAVLDLYGQTTGSDRNAFIQAIGSIIDEEADRQPVVLAQVVHLVATLDIAQADPNIFNLSEKRIAQDPVVKDAIEHYRAARSLHGQEWPMRVLH